MRGQHILITVVLAFFIAFAVEAFAALQVALWFGVLSAIGLTLLTGLVGLYIVRRQGMDTIEAAQKDLKSGRTPVVHVIHGLGLIVAGLLLFLPGFASDAIGILLLIPPIRLGLGLWAVGQFAGQLHVMMAAANAQGAARDPSQVAPDIVDLDDEMWHEANPTKPPQGPPKRLRD